MRTSKLQKVIFFMLCLLVICAAFGFYLTYQDVKNKTQKYHTLSRDLSFQNNKQEYLDVKLKTIEDNALLIEKIDGSIISKEKEVAFIEGLEALAKENGLSIEIISLTIDEKVSYASSTIAVLKINAETKGNWTDSYKFLKRLESMPYKIKVNKYNLMTNISNQVKDEQKESLPINNWQCTFEIEVLKYK